MVCLHTLVQIWLVLGHYSFGVSKNEISLTNRLKTNTNFWCYQEVLKPYLPSLPDLNTVNKANYTQKFNKHCKYKNKDHRHLVSMIEDVIEQLSREKLNSKPETIQHTCWKCLRRGEIILKPDTKITIHIDGSLEKTLLRRIWRRKYRVSIYRQKNVSKFKWNIILTRCDKFTNTAFWK